MGSFCFAHGDLPVECMDDFHWCYEGNCGPEFWETRFEDCAGESQSPINVEWPEDSLANAQPGQLTFEGYDRLRAGELKSIGEKTVGNVLYQLFSEGDASQLARYNCLNGCIYKDEEDPEGPSFCFAHGDLPVECKDDFHWCYEGNCGPEFWE